MAKIKTLLIFFKERKKKEKQKNKTTTKIKKKFGCSKVIFRDTSISR